MATPASGDDHIGQLTRVEHNGRLGRLAALGANVDLAEDLPSLRVAALGW
ncbi:hypothetical protein [Frankia sp. CcWB3]